MATEAEPRERIWQVVAGIPVGKVASYSQVARMAGLPRHARYVGRVLKALPADTRLPWFRVLNAKGEIAFAEGSDSYRRQIERLEAEGVSWVGRRVASVHRLQED